MKKLLTYSIILTLVCACKDETPISLSSDNSLKGVVFQKILNNSLPQDINAVTNQNTFYITIPFDGSLTAIIPTFNVHQKASVLINDIDFQKDKSIIDFTNTVKVTVISESKIKKDYFICAKRGRSDLDALVYTFMTKYNIPGVSISIGSENGMLYSSGYGYTNTDTKEKVTSTHLFRLASVTKSHTSLAIMRLVELGKIKLDDLVFGENGILKDEFGIDMSGFAKQVTVRHLLEHTSGWSSSPVDPMFTSNTNYAGKTLKERIDYVVKYTNQVTDPGTKHAYYNLGYGILGMIIEKAAKTDYETFLKQEVYSKAGISDIYVGKQLSQRRSNEVVYYGQDGLNPYNNDLEMLKAAAGIIASTEDLVKLLRDCLKTAN